MIINDPKKRITVKEALDHNFFSDVSEDCRIPTLPNNNCEYNYK